MTVRGWLLDTNVVAALISPNGAPSVKDWASGVDEDRLFLSVLTLGEYERGIHNLPEDDWRRSRISAIQEGLAARFEGRVLPVTEAVVRRWGMVAGTVKRLTGHPSPVIDTLFAATALEHGLTLVTRNVQDVRHSGAVVFNPWGSP
ncbi:type II toxin-antitoxin system VapC family toxin [Nitrospirillum sp. BR 11163]|uniref:type II toxin-antitoxin system VapC family toxin n=1 Tax=Nitrospirillum sp. BR 11163 TaxID=3104323 RepID=UPI002AFE274C|nr:type II toxin-antitoxin system VapC family toxin [Nitrospirillum sp. BR 11163]MEA1674054.1 type II toxin-antitoxin system VapC family toxin [Nitrospirillum sp. BR 11163]